MGLTRRASDISQRLRSGAALALARFKEGGMQRLGARALERLSRRFPRIAELVRSGQPSPWAAGAPPGPSDHARPAGSSGPVPEALSRLACAQAWRDRMRAAQALSGVSTAEAALVRALADPVVEVACAAADALASLHGASTTRALLEVLRDRERYFNPQVRAGCAMALRGRKLAPEGQRLLLQCISDADAEVSIACIAALETLEIAETSQRLIELLSDTSGYYLTTTRLAAAHALCRLGGVEPHRLQALLDAESDPAVAAALRGEVSTM